MLSLMVWGWIASGFLGFLANIKTLWKMTNDIFVAGEEVFKIIFWVVSFIIHLVGGAISLGYSIYTKFKG